MRSWEINQCWRYSRMEEKKKSVRKAIDIYGTSEVYPGIFLSTKEFLEMDHFNWNDFDKVKSMDISGYPFWITTNDGKDPEGFNTIEESLKFLWKSI